MEIIDAHLHEAVPWRNWKHGHESGIELSIEIAVACMDAAGVSAAVLTSARSELVAVATKLYPDKFIGLVTYPDPTAPNIEELVAGTRELPGIFGMHIAAAGYPFARFEPARYDRAFRAAEKHQVPITMYITGFLPLLVPVIEAHPELTVVVNHLGSSVTAPLDPPFKELDDLLALSRFPNVVVKFSGAPALSKEPYPFRDLWPHLHTVIDAFGPERLMWGSSDVTKLIRFEDGKVVPKMIGYNMHNYAESVNYLRYTDEISESDKSMIFGATARRVFRWPAKP